MKLNVKLMLIFRLVLRAYSHQVKAGLNAKAKKIKEQAKKIKEYMANIKENFRFRVRFSDHSLRALGAKRSPNPGWQINPFRFHNGFHVIPGIYINKLSAPDRRYNFYFRSPANALRHFKGIVCYLRIRKSIKPPLSLT